MVFPPYSVCLQKDPAQRVLRNLFDGPKQNHDRSVMTMIGGLPAASRRKLVVNRAGEQFWGELMVALFTLILKTNLPDPASRIVAEARFGRERSTNSARLRRLPGTAVRTSGRLRTSSSPPARSLSKFVMLRVAALRSISIGDVKVLTISTVALSSSAPRPIALPVNCSLVARKP